MSPVFEDGVVRVGVEDTGVDTQLAAIDAKFKASMAALGRTEATIRIKGDISELKRNVDEAKARLVALSAEEAALSRKQGGLSHAQWQQQLKDLGDQKTATENLIKTEQGRVDTMGRYFAQLQQTRQLENVREAEQKARDRADADRTRLAGVQEQSRLREVQQLQRLITLQKQYADAKSRVDSLAKAATTAQGADKQRVQLDSAGAIADMTALHERLRLLGEKPITQRVNVDTNAAEKAWNLFTHGTLDGQGTKTTIDDVGKKLKSMLSTSVNVGPFNTSIGGLVTTLGTLAPVIAAVGGAAGALVGSLGSGLVGAAGLGGAALTGFGLAAVGVKAALQSSLLQLSTFKSELNTFQATQLKYGPASTTTPASTAAAARVPIDQGRVALDQTRLNDAIKAFGKDSPQAAAAALTLASAQNTLNSAQTRATTGANRTQRALNQLNSIIAQSSPPMRAAERNWLALSQAWTKLTGNLAQRDFGTALNQTFITARANVGWFARDTKTALNDLSGGWNAWMKSLRSPDAKGALDNIFKNFDSTIKPVMDGLDHIGAALGRWFSTMSNYLPGIAKAFDSWATGVDHASQATDGWAQGSVTLIASLKSIGHFAIEAGKWLFALFQPAVRPGNNLFEDMANNLNRSATAMRTLQGQNNLADFFQRSIKGTEQLWHALTPLAAVFIHLAALFAPLASAAVPAITLFTQMGAEITKLLGPFGHLLLDITGFLVAGRLVGKLSPLLDIMGSLRTSALRVGAAFAGVAAVGFKDSGGIGGIVSRWKQAGIDASATEASRIEAVLNAGAEKIAADFEAAGNVVAERIGGAMEAAGTTDAAEIGGAMEAAGTADAVEIGAATALGGAGSGAITGTAAKELAAAGGTGEAVTGGTLSGLGAAGIGGLGALGLLAFLSKDSISNQQTPSGQFLAGFTPGFGGTAFRQQQASQFDQLQHDQATPPAGRARSAAAAAAPRGNQVPGQVAPDPRAGGAGHLPTPQFTSEQKAKVLDDAVTLGRQVGEQLNAGWNQFKFADEPTMFKQLRSEFKNPKLNDAARASAAEAAISFSLSLEKQGRLAKGSAQIMLEQVESEFPQLAKYLGRTAKEAATAFKINLNISNARKSLQDTLNGMKGDFTSVTDVMESTKGSVQQKSAAMVKALLDIARHGSAPARALAIKDIHDIERTQATSFGNIVSNVRSAGNQFKNAVSTNSNAAFRIGSANFNGLAHAIAGAIGGGAEATGVGLKNITDQVNAAIKQFGGGALSATAVAAATPNQLAALLGGFVTAVSLNPQSGTGPGGLPGHAEGGRVPGPNGGMDTWTLVDAAGIPRGRVGGGELLIANRHTEEAASMATQMVFGQSLGEMVTGENRPHSHFSTGGWQNVVASAESNGGTGYHSNPISPYGYSELGVPPTHANIGTAMGQLPYQTHMRIRAGNREVVAAKEDIGTGSSFNPVMGLYPGTVAQLGLSGGEFHVSIERADGVPLTVGSAGGGAGPIHINVPQVHGKGLMAALVKANLTKTTAQANKFVQAQQAKFQPAGGSPFGGAGSSGPNGLGTFDGLQVADWIIPVLNWARSHGWSGHITSGFRPGGGSEHAGTQWPGGAVDVGWNTSIAEGTALENVLQRYPGHPNLLWGGTYISGYTDPRGVTAPGGHDYGHFSGTGHATGGRLTPQAKMAARRKSGAGSHRSAGKHVKVPGPEAQALKDERLWHQVQVAQATYENYNANIHSKHPHFVGKPGHFTGKPGHRGSSGKWIASTQKWHPSTVHKAGGITPQEEQTLNKDLKHYQLLLTEYNAEVPKGERGARPFTSVYDLPAKDRIGGVGTSDIDAALTAAQQEFQDYDQNIHQKTDSKGKAVKPTKDELRQDAFLKGMVQDLTKLQTNANSAITDFGNIESEIGTLGTYMDNASASSDDKSWGYDPGRGNHPQPGKHVKYSWSQWKSIREYWEKKHTSLLQKALQDARKGKNLGTHPNKYNLAYLKTLENALGVSLSDEEALKSTVDSGGTPQVGSGDDYIKSIGLEPQLEKLNYQYSLDQGKVVEDDPGTAAREDLVSMFPETADAQNIMNFYQGVLARAQRDPKTKNNFPLLTSLSDTYNSARSTWMGLEDQFKTAATQTGPSQVAMSDTAKAAIFQAYASNVAPPITSAAAGGGAAAAEALGAPNPASMASATPAGGGSGDTTVHMTNHFAVGPSDPHSWSQGVNWELQAAM